MRPYMATPVKVWVQATSSCNLACKVCYGDCKDAPHPDELSFEEHLRLIDYFVEHDVMHVMYEGGEPLLRPDFLEIVRYAGRRLLTWVRTNGTLLTPSTAFAIKEAGVNTVVVDLFGATPQTHERIVGQAGAYARTIRAIRLLREVDIDLVMAFILNRLNAGELQAYAELAKELGVRRVGCLRLYPLGRAKANWSRLALSLEEQHAVIDAVEPPEGVQVMRSWHPKDTNCCWQNAAIDAYGVSIGCPYLRDLVDFGNIRSIPLLQTWEDPLYRQLRDATAPLGCTGCENVTATRGGCRSTAFAFTGRWDGQDPFCSHMNASTDLRVLPRRYQELTGPAYRADDALPVAGG